MEYIQGKVTLPDGREVNATCHLHRYEPDTGAQETAELEIEWLDGTPLTTDEYNQEVAKNYFLHEWVEEKVRETGTYEIDENPDI